MGEELATSSPFYKFIYRGCKLSSINNISIIAIHHFEPAIRQVNDSFLPEPRKARLKLCSDIRLYMVGIREYFLVQEQIQVPE